MATGSPHGEEVLPPGSPHGEEVLPPVGGKCFEDCWRGWLNRPPSSSLSTSLLGHLCHFWISFWLHFDLLGVSGCALQCVFFYIGAGVWPFLNKLEKEEFPFPSFFKLQPYGPQLGPFPWPISPFRA